MTPERCAEIYARAFQGHSRLWRIDEFRDLMRNPHVVFVHRSHSFAFARVVADEAELLTIATDPPHQGQGLGHACLQNLERQCALHGAAVIFLEVAATNAHAIHLYSRENYQTTGTRPNYYTHDGVAVDALLMQKPLAQDKSPRK